MVSYFKHRKWDNDSRQTYHILRRLWSPWWEMLSGWCLYCLFMMWSSHLQDFHCIWYPAAGHVHMFTIQDHFIQCISSKEFCNNLPEIDNIFPVSFFFCLLHFLMWDHCLVETFDHSYFECSSLAEWLERGQSSVAARIWTPEVSSSSESLYQQLGLWCGAKTLTLLEAGNGEGISLCEILVFSFYLPKHVDTTAQNFTYCVRFSGTKFNFTTEELICKNRWNE